MYVMKECAVVNSTLTGVKMVSVYDADSLTSLFTSLLFQSLLFNMIVDSELRKYDINDGIIHQVALIVTFVVISEVEHEPLFFFKLDYFFKHIHISIIKCDHDRECHFRERVGGVYCLLSVHTWQYSINFKDYITETQLV